jgi:sortase A
MCRRRHSPGKQVIFAIAAHRDTLFRALKDIRQGDLVSFESPAGTYRYQVFSTRIVKPSDVNVLRPDGGVPSGTGTQTPMVINRNDKLLTMITCYPFYYVGSAPKRFIVQARLVTAPPHEQRAVESGSSPPAPQPEKRPTTKM